VTGAVQAGESGAPTENRHPITLPSAVINFQLNVKLAKDHINGNGDMNHSVR